MFERFVNKLLSVFGYVQDGSQRVRWHWQNLNDGPKRKTNLPIEGRWWLYFNRGDGAQTRHIHFCWNLWSKFCGADVEVNGHCGEELVSFFVALPPFAFWLSYSDWKLTNRLFREKLKYEAREVSVKVHDWKVWWSFWCDPHSWSAKTPKWRDGNLDILRVFGKHEYKRVPTIKGLGHVVMPEGVYEAEVTINDSYWWRSYFPMLKQHIRGATVDLKKPIPYEGKGENSWDCGTDGMHSISLLAKTIPEALKKTADRAMETRQRRGDTTEYPNPSVASASL